MVPLSLNHLNSAGQRDTEYHVPLEVSPKFAHSRPKSPSSNALKFAFSSLEAQSRIWTKFGVILFPCHRPSLEGPMISPIRSLLRPVPGQAAIVLIRIAVGLIFSTQGFLKYIDPNMGVARFARIGFPHSYFTAHFVGAIEITCGLLVLLGFWVWAAGIPLLIVITTAIATTKIPELFRANQGFWYMVSDARTDFAMFCSLLFLIFAGAGSWSLDELRRRQSVSG